ncbi:MAG TPA: 23S rRNA (adenine(2503)-C(2))-methyltransferase RlmN [Candidatus Sphingobacterium stercoripullorum]|uniref:Probable dual-specificity RNA methyltransferase RlmN n=1 Tax=Candidatus Sphingobacterium stercoripullorum TaxID=2838759 RepID=A0A9D1W8J2_9SPHI|nr:23S rRNA (adenine(2503)-C(2))-methyltransferase RlmN [Candidatus Sphingobacterium stercoripullorum]
MAFSFFLAAQYDCNSVISLGPVKKTLYLCTIVEKKIAIREQSLEQLQEQLVALNEPKFRSKQLFQWLWEKSCVDFNQMSNLSLGLREKLIENYFFREVEVESLQVAADKTIKSIFKLFDGEKIEGVLIPTSDRMTACVSSQVGCSLSCKFCATGYMDRKRNVYAEEIYDQVVLINRQALKNYGQGLTNIVFMGMGEPLLNYSQVLKAIDRITSEDGLNMSPRRITVSTAGIAKMIKKLGDDAVRFNLALSLHAANDEKRDKIMPINEQNSLEVLKDALLYFHGKTKNQITFEYIVFNNFNDTIEDAKELAVFCKQIPSKVNLIEYNPIEMADFQNAEEDKIDQFAAYLESQNISVTVRRSRGKDIDAACGQLAIKEK